MLANGTEVAHAPTVAGVPTVATRKPTLRYERSRHQRRRVQPEAIAMLQRILQSSGGNSIPVSGGEAQAEPPHLTSEELQLKHTLSIGSLGMQ